MADFQTPIAVAVIARTRHKMIEAEIREAAKQGAKLIEIRFDFLAKAPDFKRLLQNRPCPIIATFRRPSDGGRFNAPDEQRLMLIRQAIVAGVDYIDLEIDIIDQIPRFGKVKRICSYHNMTETPEKLELIHKQMCEEDADIIKIAVTAQNLSDNLRVLALMKNPPKPTVAFCMGDLGVCTRVLGIRAGSPFTYSTFNKDRQIAPGIISFQELQKLYKIEQITPETKVFGVIGDPVGHSLSPLIHNKAMRKIGLNAVYLPFRVPRGDLPAFLNSMKAVPVDGYSVTLPHKEAAAAYAQELGPAVKRIGAANTLVAIPNGFRAVNTDAHAALATLKANLPPGPDGAPGDLRSRFVLILGAGGVARAIADALQADEVPVTVTNRSPERGEKLAQELDCKFVEWNARHSVICDTIINCTSVGMHPNLDETPIHHSFLKSGMMVFDTIYTPETTMLVREARERGCHVLTGVDMFIRQAAMQFELFTGKPPPIEYMTKVIRRALAPVHEPDDEEPAK